MPISVQNVTSCFQVRGNFLIKIRKLPSKSKAKIKCHRNIIASIGFTYFCTKLCISASYSDVSNLMVGHFYVLHFQRTQTRLR